MSSLLRFFSLTFAVTWTCFLAAAAVSGGVAPTASSRAAPLGLLLLFLGIFAPALVALSLTAREEGRGAVGALLRRLLEWRVGARWYAFALGYMAAIKLAAALAYRLGTGAWPAFGESAWYLLLAATIGSTMVGGQAGEEIGWRGYALPRLTERLGLAGASVLLGVIWAAWHLPLFYLRGADTYGQSFTVYLLQVTALSVAMAWVYGHTGGSLLLMMLMHSAINNTTGLVPSVARAAASPFGPSASLLSWLTAALLWIGAAYLLARMPGRGTAGVGAALALRPGLR